MVGSLPAWTPASKACCRRGHLHASAAAGAARQMKVECEKLGVTHGDRVQEADLLLEAPCARAHVQVSLGCPDWLAISNDGSQGSADEILLLQRVSKVILVFVGYSA